MLVSESGRPPKMLDGEDALRHHVGMDNSALYQSADVKGHWAELHQLLLQPGHHRRPRQCRFDPAATVTGNEAAKMLLVAAGCDAQLEA